MSGPSGDSPAESRSRVADGAWLRLDELVETAGLEPAEIDQRLGWEPGTYAVWRRDPNRALLEDYFDVLGAVGPPDGSGEQESRLWQLTLVVLDVGLTVGFHGIRTGTLEAGAVQEWFEEWWTKLRALTPLEEED